MHSDNKNVPQILKVGSRKTKLHKIAVDIRDICTNTDINIHTHWLPISKNEHVERLSRHADPDD